MKYVYPELEAAIDTDNGCYNTLVIENQRLLVRLIGDICRQITGLEGEGVLSADQILPMSKYACLLDTFVPFDLNKKTLITKLVNALDRAAQEEERFEDTAGLLRDTENWLNRLSLQFSSDIVFTNVSASAIIKACSPEIRSDKDSLAEQILDFMELIREFDRDRLFITLNLRSFISDEEMELFVNTALAHGFNLLGIECCEHARLSRERRTIVDADLCEIGPDDII